MVFLSGSQEINLSFLFALGDNKTIKTIVSTNVYKITSIIIFITTLASSIYLFVFHIFNIL